MKMRDVEEEITKINIASDAEREERISVGSNKEMRERGERISIASDIDKDREKRQSNASSKRLNSLAFDVKLQRERISSAKSEQKTRFEWKSRSQLVYYLVFYAVTGDAIDKIIDVGNVKDKMTLYHILIVNAIFSIPLLYMELFLGQYSKTSCLTFGKITPIAYGLGFTMMLLAITRISFNSCELGDTILYTFHSAQRPWIDCEKATEDTKNNYNCIPLPKSNEQGADLWSENLNARLSSYIYWRNEILKTNDTNTDIIGPIVISRLICLICIWIFLSLLLLMGLGGGWEFLYKFFIWIILICSAILCISMAFTNGGTKYLSHMFWTNYHDLIDLKVYCYAVHISIMSLSFAQGVYIIIGTYLKPTTSTSLLAMLIVVINLIVSTVTYIFHYTSMGILSEIYRENKEDLHIQGNDFGFATIPHALGNVTFSRLLTFLYFLAVFCCYCGNVISLSFVIFYTIIEAKEDMSSYKTYIITGICIVGFLLGVSFVTETGPNQIKCLTIHVIMTVRILVLTFETVSVLWLYTFPRLCDDIHFFYGSQPSVYWKLLWAFLPFFLLIVLIFYCVEKNSYPQCNIWITIMVFVIYLLPILIGALYKTYINLRKHNLVAVLKPEEDWGPRDLETRIIRNTMNPRMETRLNKRSYRCKHKCLLRSAYLKKVIAEEEKWYNMYLDKQDSIDADIEENGLSEDEEEDEMSEVGTVAFSISQLSSLTLKSNLSKSNVKKS